ncbi:secreted cell-adhesion lipoprotein [Phycomyces blakesleeanus]|uniref:Secreted cell-adhesion lipoprotein n=1 Tax=Phycomyces blakesleeanus TaxID=4837 RepID=A0ABR3AK06_PHYBL
MLGKVVTAMALGATVVTAQLSNSSIFSILNTSQLSPSYKFAQYLQSSPDFQPVVDLLSQPGNLTVFIPSDEALDQAIQLANSTNSNSTTGHNTTSGAHNSTKTDQNFTLIELIKYHIVNNTFDLSEIPVQDNLTYVANSMVTNETVNKFENGLPLVIDSNTTIINNTLWNTTSSSSTTPIGYRVGNGEVTANVLLRDIIASNGRLNIIDKVLVPPVSPTNVIDNVTSTSDFKKLFLQYPQIAAQLNSTNNFTLFAPTDKALNGFDYKKYDNQTLMNLMQTHVLEGLYYTTNFTEATSGNGTAQVSAMNGAQFPVTVSNNGSVITLNNTAHIVKSNVLFNNGVMHLIDQVLQPQAQTNQTQATQPSQNAQSSQNVQPTQSNGNVQPSQTDVVPSNTADPNQPMQPSQSNQDDQPSQPNPETPLPQT